MDEETCMKKLGVSLSHISTFGITDKNKCRDELKVIRKLYYERDGKYREQIALKLSIDNFSDNAITFMKAYKSEELTKDDWSNSYKVLLAVLWNYSCHCEKFAQSLLDAGVISFCLMKITRGWNTGIQRLSEFGFREVRGCLNILQNIIYLYPQCRQTYVNAKVAEKVKPYVTYYDERLKKNSVMLVAACMTDQEIKLLEDTGAVRLILEYIENSINNTEQHAGVVGNAKALYILSVNDSIKERIVEEGALPILLRLMKSSNNDWQEMAARTIWQLSFHGYSKQMVMDEKGCVATLRKLANSENSAVKEAASGALWTLEDKEKYREQQSNKLPAGEKHIFISYSWHMNADIVRRVAEQLKKDKFKVWIDTEKMGGSTMVAMANAIENAWLCLICSSEPYRQSANCHAEAEYVFTTRLPIVPLLMQPQYKHEGWLGFLLGSRLYINFGKREVPFESNYEKLRDQIQKQLENDPKAAGIHVTVISKTPSQVGSQTSSEKHTKTATAVSQASLWTKEQVEDWVKTYQFSSPLNAKLVKFLKSLAGSQLADLCEIKKEAPDFLYQRLIQEYDATLLQVMALRKALDSLP